MYDVLTAILTHLFTHCPPLHIIEKRCPTCYHQRLQLLHITKRGRPSTTFPRQCVLTSEVQRAALELVCVCRSPCHDSLVSCPSCEAGRKQSAVLSTEASELCVHMRLLQLVSSPAARCRGCEALSAAHRAL